MRPANQLILNTVLPVRACNGGFLISRGKGMHPERRIDSYELIMVQRGCLGMQEEGHPFVVNAGQTLLLWPHRQHGGVTPYPPDLAFYWVHFRLAAAGCRIPAKKFKVPQCATLKDPDRLIMLFRLFMDDQESGLLRPLTANLLLLLMLCEAARLSRPNLPDNTPAAVLAGQANIFIHTHFHEPITTATIAGALHCNPDYLGRICREAFGHTLTTHIHERRLRHARRLLMDSSLNIKEIAQACGFMDVGYFRRIFKRHQGTLPLAYRRRFARMHVNTE